jgi:hypothetical protein
LQKVITVSEIMSSGGWGAGQEITPIDLLVNFDTLTKGLVTLMQMECGKQPATETCQNRWQSLLAKYPFMTSSDKMPNTRVFIKSFPGDNVPGCGFVAFRGTNDQVYRIPAFMKFGADQPIRGDQIFTVFFNEFCQPSPNFSSIIPFFLIDATELWGSWACGIPDWAARGVLGETGFSVAQDPQITNTSIFDMRSLVTDFQAKFLPDQVHKIPEIMYIEQM